MSSIDVVIPNYNYGHYLEDCVRGVLAQGIDELRVLIIDNASGDDSQAVARRLAAADPRVELELRPKNLGPHASFNQGIDWARSDYFLILCSDDQLAPGALRHAIALMEQRPDVHLAFGQPIFVSGGEPILPHGHADDQGTWSVLSGRAMIERFCRTARNPVSGPTAVVRTRVQKRVGHYRTSLSHTDDMEMWMRFALQGNVAETTRVQAMARVHAASQSSSVANIHRWNLEFGAAFASFFRHEGAAMRDAPALLALANRSLAERAYWSALGHLARREAGAGTLMAFACRTCPSLAVMPPIGHLLRRFTGRLWSPQRA